MSPRGKKDPGTCERRRRCTVPASVAVGSVQTTPTPLPDEITLTMSSGQLSMTGGSVSPVTMETCTAIIYHGYTYSKTKSISFIQHRKWVKSFIHV